jgi:hypothetical protein
VVEVLFTEGLIFGSAAGVAPGTAQPAVTRLADVARQDGEVGIEAEFWLSVVLARTGNATAAEQARQRAVARRPSLAHLAQNLIAAGVLPEKGATS